MKNRAKGKQMEQETQYQTIDLGLVTQLSGERCCLCKPGDLSLILRVQLKVKAKN